MSEIPSWEERYRTGDVPWDTGNPSSELKRVLAEEKIQPCRAIDLGCGTGSNAIWLAQQGFEVTGLDVSKLAIEHAKEKARSAGVKVDFIAGDVCDPPDLGSPFQFFLDRGCYHCVRREIVWEFLHTLESITAADAMGLVLAGNAKEPLDPGPPVVTEQEIRNELGSLFEIVRLREFRFDAPPGWTQQPLAWSCLLKKLPV